MEHVLGSVWVVLVDPSPADPMGLLGNVKTFLVDLGVWGLLGQALAAMIVLSAVSFVWRTLRN